MSVNVFLPPYITEIDGCKVYIYNIIPYTTLRGVRRYIVSVRVEYMGKLSKQFTIDIATESDLVNILKKEIVLFKSIVLSGGYDVYART